MFLIAGFSFSVSLLRKTKGTNVDFGRFLLDENWNFVRNGYNDRSFNDAPR